MSKACEILQVEIWIDPESGQSTGRIKHPDSLLRAVETLITRSRVTAVAVVARFPDDDIGDIDAYRQGKVCNFLIIMVLLFKENLLKHQFLHT